jgi:hypothetical protein
MAAGINSKWTVHLELCKSPNMCMDCQLVVAIRKVWRKL